MPPDREVKCQAARDVIDLLKQNPPVPVLHVGGLALDEWHQDWRRWGTEESDDLHLLIQHGELDSFMDRMEEGDYSLADYQPKPGTVPPTGFVKGLKRDKELKNIKDRPVGPHAAYVQKKFVGQVGPPDLWVRFHTTTRHGALPLIDLEDWFEGFDQLPPVPVMQGTPSATDIRRPPLWAMVLWQAAQVTSYASDCAITKDEVDKLHVIAAHMDAQEWTTTLAKAEEYDAQYKRRAKYCTETLHMDEEHLQYGVLYEVRYPCESLAAYGLTGGYQTDWSDVESRVQGGTGERPRKIWGYAAAKRGKFIPPGTSRGVVGTIGLGIREQIDHHPQKSYQDLETAGLVHTVISNAPPHGPWARCKKEWVKDIFKVA